MGGHPVLLAKCDAGIGDAAGHLLMSSANTFWDNTLHAFGDPRYSTTGYLNRYGADPTGATFSDAAFNLAVLDLASNGQWPTLQFYSATKQYQGGEVIFYFSQIYKALLPNVNVAPAAGHVSSTTWQFVGYATGGVLQFGPGTYKFNTALPMLGAAYSVMGQPGGGTYIYDYGTAGDLFRFSCFNFPTTNITGFSRFGRLSDVVIDGTNTTSGRASAVHYGDLNNGTIENVVIQHYFQANQIGLWLDNTVGWTERSRMRGVLVKNCTTHIQFDVGSGTVQGATTANKSFDYGDYDFHIAPNGNQNGVVINNGACLDGVDFKLRANATRSSVNSGCILTLTGSSANLDGTTNSEMSSCNLDLVCELDGSSTLVGTLNGALVTGTPITSIPVNALAAILPASTLTITNGVNTQNFVTAGAAQGATAIPVTSVTPNFAYPNTNSIYIGQSHQTIAFGSTSNTIFGARGRLAWLGGGSPWVCSNWNSASATLGFNGLAIGDIVLGQGSANAHNIDTIGPYNYTVVNNFVASATATFAGAFKLTGVRVVTTTPNTVTSTDLILRCNMTSTLNLTIPSISGRLLYIFNTGTATMNLVAGSGMTFDPGCPTTIAANGRVIVFLDAANIIYCLSGS